jgi:RP/EB family microtubule-associated protein
MEAALELLQWIHGYWVSSGERRDYNGPERRKQVKCRDLKAATLATKQSVLPSEAPRPAPPPVQSPKQTAVKSVKLKVKTASLRGTETVMTRAISQASHTPPLEVHRELKRETSRQELSRIREDIQQMSQERDFYFDKLRRVEEVCQEAEGEPIIRQILDILYETDPERGFLPPEKEDE